MITTPCIFSPDGTTIAAGSWDGNVMIWNIKTGKLLQTLSGHYRPIYSLAFSPNGNSIIAGDISRTINSWSVHDGKRIHSLNQHSSLISSIHYSANGKYIISSSFDNTIKIWDANTGQLLLNLYTFDDDANKWLVLSPDGRYDGSPEGLEFLHYSDGVQSFPFNPQNNPKYTKGLLREVLEK